MGKRGAVTRSLDVLLKAKDKILSNSGDRFSS